MTQLDVRHIESRFKKLIEESEPLVEKAAGKDRANFVRESLENLKHEFFVDAESVFPPNDKRRLKELQLQFLLYRLGPIRFLTNATIKKTLRLPDLSLHQLRKKQAKISNSLLAKEASLVKEAVDIWLEPLSADQRKTFDRDWSSLLSKRGSLSLLLLSFESEFKFNPNELQKDEITTVWPNAPTLRHSANGNVEWAPSKPVDSHKKPAETSRLYGLQHLLRSDFLGQLIELLPQQHLEIADVNADFESKKIEIVLQIAGEFDVPIRSFMQSKSHNGTQASRPLYDWPADRSAIDAAMEKRLSAPAAEAYIKLLDILLPHQVDFLKLAIARLRTRYCGPYQDVKSGELKESLALDQNQLTAMIDSADTAKKFLAEKSRDVRDDAIKEFMKQLPDDVGSRVLKGLGEPIRHGHCDLSNLAIAFISNGNR